MPACDCGCHKRLGSFRFWRDGLARFFDYSCAVAYRNRVADLPKVENGERQG